MRLILPEGEGRRAMADKTLVCPDCGVETEIIRSKDGLICARCSALLVVITGAR